MLYAEPFLLLVLGGLMCMLSQVVGVFMMLAIVTLTVRNGIEHEVYRARLRRLRDAEIEGTWMSRKIQDRDWY